MNLPNAKHAEVTEEKILKYLLSSSHRIGRSKAAFFAKAGFRPERWKELAESLKKHARENKVILKEENPFGVRYIIEGTLRTPGTEQLNVRTVWFISKGEKAPRLVTAYPARKKV